MMASAFSTIAAVTLADPLPLVDQPTAVLVQVHQPGCDVTPQFERILARERAALDHLADVKALEAAFLESMREATSLTADFPMRHPRTSQRIWLRCEARIQRPLLCCASNS